MQVIKRSIKVSNSLVGLYKTNAQYLTRTLASQAKTAGDDRLKEIDMAKEFDKLSPSEKLYIKKLDAMNKKRLESVQRRKKFGRIAGISLTLFALSVYFYTMYAIQQEKFLDDFTVPEPPDPAVKKF